MNQLPYLAVIVDLDRTLLRTDKTISDYTLDVLREWQQAGAYLFAATARPERAITDYCRIIDFQAVTTLNGARTITPDGVYENTIATEDALSILEQLSGIDDMVISVEAENGIYANKDIPIWSPRVIEDIGELPRWEKIYKILASHPDCPPEQILIDLPETVYSTVADKKLRQYMGSTATKWRGIRQLLDSAKLEAEQAVYFGDDNDDIEPIRRCGYGVAVSNALDCVKAVADEVAESNDEDGVARTLARLWTRG